MDNPAPRLRYGPNRAIAAGAAAAAVLMVGLLLTTTDRNGQLLYAIAAAVLVVVCVVDLWWNPRLVVDAGGLTIRSPGGSGRIGWAEIERLRVDEHTRLGLSARTLEIDTGQRLIILSRRSLGGADPRDVAELIEAFRPPA